MTAVKVRKIIIDSDEENGGEGENWWRKYSCATE